MSEIKIYKIQDTNTGLFSRGGADCDTSKYRWGKLGKTWNSIGHLKSHLKQYDFEYKYVPEADRYMNIFKGVPDSWEVVELSSVTGEKDLKQD